MGREIRKVPMGWEHPKNSRGEFIPLHDEEFETAARRWMDACIAWDQGTHKDLVDGRTTKEEVPYFWLWDAEPPRSERYRLKWNEEPSCFQIYENVSEGTPVSPVFETEAEMREWLIAQGYSAEATDAFIRDKYAPTMMIGPDGIKKDIETLGE